jgi:thiamine biosynthesis protein ThiS
MHVTVNGERRELAGPMTVSSLLKELRIDSRRVAVELNRRILKRGEFDDVEVSDGDELEVVHFVGGGY